MGNGVRSGIEIQKEMAWGWEIGRRLVIKEKWGITL